MKVPTRDLLLGQPYLLDQIVGRILKFGRRNQLPDHQPFDLVSRLMQATLPGTSYPAVCVKQPYYHVGYS